MDVLLHQSAESFSALKEDWNRLVDETEGLTLFQRAEWNECWWRAFGEGGELYLIEFREDGRLIGLAPFFRRQAGVGAIRFREVILLGDGVSDYGQPLIAAGREEEVWRALLDFFAARPGEWDVLRLDELPQKAFDDWSRCASGKTPSWRREAGRTFVLPVTQNWNAYFETLSKRGKKKYRRQQRVLQNCPIRKFSGREITPELLAALAEINRRGPRNKCFGSLFLSEPYRRFHWDLLFATPLGEMFNIEAQFCGDKPAAYIYGFHYKGVLWEYNSNYDTTFSVISVGNYLHLAHIQDALNTACFAALDFLRGDYDYKRNLQTRVNQNYRVVHFRDARLRFAYRLNLALAETVRRLYARWCVPVKLNLAGFGERCRRGWAYLRSRGLLHALRVGFGVFWRAAYINTELLIMQVNPKKAALVTVPARMREGIEVRELTLADFGLLEGYVGAKHMPMMVRRFWDEDRCWGAIQAGRLIGYGWVTPNHQVDDQFKIRVQVEKEYLYLYDALVSPEYRGRGLLVIMINAILQDPQIKKARFFWAMVRPDNRPIIKTLSRFNFKAHLRVRRLRIGFWFGRQTQRPAEPETVPAGEGERA